MLNKLIVVTFIIAVVLVIVTVPVWLLWNWLMPVIFGLPQISLLQATGLLVLSSLLFRSTTSIKG